MEDWIALTREVALDEVMDCLMMMMMMMKMMMIERLKRGKLIILETMLQ
jgi:hypothetical protein